MTRNWCRKACVTALCALGAVGPVSAHPHIFVDATIEVIFDDQGRASAVRIGWVYDEFFSMLLVSDMGLDPDFTGEVTAEEQADLDGFDMNWIDGYHGDVFIRQGDQDLVLSGPSDWTSDYREGQLRSTHLRQIEPPVPAQDGVVISVYDPTYYTAYSVIGTPVLTGTDNCEARIFEPDWDVADEQLNAAMDELLGAGADLEANFPEVGALFADEVRITCAAPA